MNQRGLATTARRNPGTKTTLGLFAATAVLGINPAAASAIDRVNVVPGPNGPVTAISSPDSSGTTYLGGEFTAWNEIDAGSGDVLTPTSGELDRRFPYVKGEVTAVASDGNGGWYIGGLFTTVGNTGIFRAAHINSDGSPDTSWKPNPNGSVDAIAVSGSTVYLGGRFTKLGSKTRSCAAAVDRKGVVQAWNPRFNGFVSSIAVSGSSVYIGGGFTKAGSTTRNGAAAVGADGVLQPWNPNVDNSVYALAVSGSTVYLGGAFGKVGGQTRNRAAAVGTGGAIGAWNPNPNGSVLAIAVSGDTIYLGGRFGALGAQSRNHAAAVASNGVVQAWNPDVADIGHVDLSSSVNAIAVSGNTVYLGGEFAQVGSEDRNCLAAVGTDGSVQPLNLNLASACLWGSGVNAIATDGTGVYIARGSNDPIGGQTRNHVAAVGSDGSLRRWNPGADWTVKAIAVSGDTVYLGGAFTHVGDQPRNFAAAVGTDGILRSWNPNVEGLDSAAGVFGLAVAGSNVYLGGNFTSVGGVARSNAAAVAADGSLQAWAPDPESPVNAIAGSGSTLYLGGDFVTVGGQARSHAGAVNTDGTVAAWNPGVNHSVRAIAVSRSPSPCCATRARSLSRPKPIAPLRATRAGPRGCSGCTPGR